MVPLVEAAQVGAVEETVAEMVVVVVMVVLIVLSQPLKSVTTTT